LTVKIENMAIARRYASAFFALVKEQKAIKDIASDIDSITSMIDSSTDFRNLITNATLRRSVQESAITAIADKAKLQDLTKKFLGLISMNRRLSMLPDIIIAVQNEMAEYKGEITAKVISATELKASQLDDISTALSKVLKLTVKLDIEQDTDIIGGLIIQVGSQRIDSSVKAKLERLHRSLKGLNKSSNKTNIREVA